jgi:hypothetical protein
MEEIKIISTTNSKLIQKSHPTLAKEVLIDMLDNNQKKYINTFVNQIEQDIRKKKYYNTSPPIKHVVVDIDIPKLYLTPK